jgi:YD repeat-containing protein
LFHDTLTKGNDYLGRINSRTEGTFNTGYSYDNLSNLKTQSDPFSLTSSYFYDNNNRLDYVTADGKTYDYAYYDDGMLKTVTYPGSIVTTYTYDNANRAETVVTKKSATVLASFTYTYDNNSNIETVTDKDNKDYNTVHI